MIPNRVTHQLETSLMTVVLPEVKSILSKYCLNFDDDVIIFTLITFNKMKNSKY